MDSDWHIPSPQQIQKALAARGPLLGWRSDGIATRATFLERLVPLATAHGNIELTQQQIAQKTGFKRRTVELLLDSLTKARVLQREAAPVGQPAHYYLDPDWFTQLPEQDTGKPATVVQTQPSARKTAKSTRPAGRAPGHSTDDQPWRKAVEELRTEFSVQLEALTRQVQALLMLNQRSTATADSGTGGISDNQDATPIPTATPASTTIPIPSDDALLERIDDRLAAFTQMLAHRIEQVLINFAPAAGAYATRDATIPPPQEREPKAQEQAQLKTRNRAGADHDRQDNALDDNNEQPGESAINHPRAEDGHTHEQHEHEDEGEGEGEGDDPDGLDDKIGDESDDPDALVRPDKVPPQQQPTTATAAATTIPQAALPLPAKRKPGRPLKDPTTANRLEARADLLFEHLRRALVLDGLLQAETLIHLARAELDWQSQHYTGDDGLPVWSTILKTNLRFTKKRLMDRAMAQLLADIPIDELEGHADQMPLIKLVKLWGSTFDTAVEEHTTRLNQQYREQARTQALDPTPVDLSNWLQLAQHTLQAVSEGKNVQWEAVSFALALATGRRQAEVHCTGALLSVGDLDNPPGASVAAPKAGYAVLFAGRGERRFGQTKVRSGTEAEKEWLARPVRTIPTLIRAELVLAGWQWLEQQGDKVEHEEQVNAAFNGKLRAFMARVATGFTYKNLRDFYASACWRNWSKDGVTETSLPERLKEVLGHGPLGDATPSYRKFCLQEGSASRI